MSRKYVNVRLEPDEFQKLVNIIEKNDLENPSNAIKLLIRAGIRQYYNGKLDVYNGIGNKYQRKYQAPDIRVPIISGMSDKDKLAIKYLKTEGNFDSMSAVIRWLIDVFETKKNGSVRKQLNWGNLDNNNEGNNNV